MGKNNWQTNVLEGGGAAFGCAAGGVKYGRLLGPWGAAIGGIGGAVVCGYLAYTATS
ncbi:bacteriocin [Streptococcus pneumoniae]|uniref:bacteriocin n=1 Tax=Streptococcus pneumoniae TaxID=1313 RepID=UPI000991766F|nr:bacteriocin [Streptococcus pneumoniae]